MKYFLEIYMYMSIFTKLSQNYFLDTYVNSDMFTKVYKKYFSKLITTSQEAFNGFASNL